MAGAYGNYELHQVISSLFINYTNASEAVTLPVGTMAISVATTQKCWIKIGQPGETAVAAVPSAEKVWVERELPLNITEETIIAVPPSTDASLVQIAVIRSTVDGVLDITALKE